MDFQNWFVLKILHEYFDKEICSVFELLPMKFTQTVMKNHNILINKKENQYSGYVGSQLSTNSWEELQMVDDLYFQLVNTDLNFNSYTDTPSNNEESNLLYLTNALVVDDEQDLSIDTYLTVQPLFFQVNIREGTQVNVVIKNSKGEVIFNQMSQNNQVSLSVNISVFETGVYELWIDGELLKTFIGTSERIKNNCYGILHLKMESILEFLRTKNRPLFKVNFIAESAYWQYAIVVSKDKKITVDSLNIEDSNGKQYLGPKNENIGNEEAYIFTSTKVEKIYQRARESPLLTMRYLNEFSDDLLELDIKMPTPEPSQIMIKKHGNENVKYSQTIVYV
ncbi:hypothetical protein [Winogradskyella sp.]|uniref:hypothetical protein n=1 Tax=Winogradskyella sp. TaxID=1883156 RepID=UPI0025D678E6|nr:hypothetical protein [Winogradskyella sp.]